MALSVGLAGYACVLWHVRGVWRWAWWEGISSDMIPFGGVKRWSWAGAITASRSTSRPLSALGHRIIIIIPPQKYKYLETVCCIEASNNSQLFIIPRNTITILVSSSSSHMHTLTHSGDRHISYCSQAYLGDSLASPSLPPRLFLCRCAQLPWVCRRWCSSQLSFNSRAFLNPGKSWALL